MDRPADNDEMLSRSAIARGVAERRPSQSRRVHTDVPEHLAVLPGESDLVLQHIGDVLANIFDP